MRRRSVAAAALALTLPHLGRAAGWPERPVRLVVPFAAGGNLDRVARLIATRLADHLGQPFVVENRSGAGGNVGALAVAQARPDGYTLLAGTNGPLINAVLLPGAGAPPGFDPARDFTPIALASLSRLAAFIAASVPARTLQEFIALCREQPGQIGIGHAGIGSNGQVGLEIFSRRAGIQVLQVAYRGGGQAVPDLLAGTVAGLFLEISSVLALHREGKGRILAIAAERRWPLLPDVPTFIEGGVPDFVEGAFFGLLGPAGMPEEATQALASALAAVLTEAELRAQYDAMAFELPPRAALTPAGFARFIAEQTERMRRNLEDAGLRPR